MGVTIYTTDTCPRCKVLKDKMNSKHIIFTECQNMDKLKELKIMSVPVLCVDDKKMQFKEAVDWINSL